MVLRISFHVLQNYALLELQLFAKRAFERKNYGEEIFGGGGGGGKGGRRRKCKLDFPAFPCVLFFSRFELIFSYVTAFKLKKQKCRCLSYCYMLHTSTIVLQKSNISAFDAVKSLFIT